jgi:GNAT superfamily N-acetyltransferase
LDPLGFCAPASATAPWPIAEPFHRSIEDVALNETLIDKPITNSPIVRPVHGHFIIRELHAPDADACDVFFHHLDRTDIRMRFASSRHFSIHDFLPGLGRVNAGLAIAAFNAAEMILGVLNLVRLNSDSAEVAVIVRSDRKRRGIGRSLIAHVIQRAEDDGLSQLNGYVLAENQPMLALARVMGFQSSRWDSFFIEVRRSISSKPG